MENYYKTISKINNEISNSKHFRNLNNLFMLKKNFIWFLVILINCYSVLYYLNVRNMLTK